MLSFNMTTHTSRPAIRMSNITRTFPGVVANSSVNLSVAAGSFHAVIGENGAGKSTLLNILFGKYQPDSGTIEIDGDDVTGKLHQPADSIRRGVGLVSQHYSLIPALSILDNLMLGSKSTTPVLSPRAATARAKSLLGDLGIAGIDLRSRAGALSIAAQQKVEIVKALYRDARILLLDEPTAALAPQEADALFQLLAKLKSRGTTIVFVTHKLREVMENSDTVTVLRNGKNAGDFITGATNTDELLAAMLGSRGTLQGTVDSIPVQSENPVPILELQSLCVQNARGVQVVRDIDLLVKRGEIVGIAGVDGSGQNELAEAIVGTLRAASGRILMAGSQMTMQSVAERMRRGIAYIPADRHRSAIVPSFNIAETYLLGHETDRNWGGGAVINWTTAHKRAGEMLQKYDVRGSSRGSVVRLGSLSGGNQQKVIAARALESAPQIIVACQPTRGLDVAATKFIHDALRKAAHEGLGVLLFSLDLDEIFEMSDRIAVMYNGAIAGVLARGEATVARVGLLMTGGMA